MDVALFAETTVRATTLTW